jgi:hypothetical protein
MMPALRPASHPGSTLRLPRAAAFWVVGGTVAALLAASSAPSPLYPIYQQEFRFSALELTAIFAVYVLAVLLSLLTVGGCPTSPGAGRCSPARWWSRRPRWRCS